MLGKPKLLVALPLFLALLPARNQIIAKPDITNTVSAYLTLSQPQFPDFTHNYEVTVLIPQQQQEAEQKAAQVAQEALEQAATPLPPVYTPPVAPTSLASPTTVQAAIIKWAQHYNVSPAWLLRVANCESGYDQTATNRSYYAGGGNPHGIFQFLPQTFYGNGGVDYNSYDDQARVAAYMFSIGQSSQWECK